MSARNLRDARAALVARLLEHDYAGGRLNVPGRDGSNFFGVVRGELEFAAVAACEWADERGPLARDHRLRDAALVALEHAAGRFASDGSIGNKGDANSPHFCLVPMTVALRALRRGGAEESRLRPLIAAAAKLSDDTAAHLPGVMEYLNPRALEAAACLGLHELTGRDDFLSRCRRCMEALLAVQYPCGAQPYHVGGWVWGRRPAQVYQLLAATMMLHVGRRLRWPEVEDYVRRLMDYELLSTNTHAEAFVSPFEGLYKVSSGSCLGWHWPLAAALHDAKYAPLAYATFQRWFDSVNQPRDISRSARFGDPSMALLNMHLLEVTDVPPAPPFSPLPGAGVRALPDISTVFVHENRLDIAMTLLTGYSSWVEADCGDVKLLALGPELTDRPTYRNFGTDALRKNWREPTEQLECTADNGAALLRGRCFTKWDSDDLSAKDETLIHTRELEVSLRYAGGELTLEYRTVRRTRDTPVPARLLLLLRARPDESAGILSVGDRRYPFRPEPFRVEAPLGAVHFTAPDGSALDLEAMIPGAERIVMERPPRELAQQYRGGVAQPHLATPIKPANDGCVRVTIEGPAVLDGGRLRLRFVPRRG